MDTIGERIRMIRKEKNLTQVDLGKVIGISGAGVGKIETNVSKPTEAALRLICSVYHVEYSWLVTGEGNMYGKLTEEERIDAFIEEHMAEERELTKSIMKAFAKLPDEEWIRLRDLIDSLKKEGSR